MLPYISVTRKQYLDRSIIHTTKLHDKLIETIKQLPVRSLEEQEKEKKQSWISFKSNLQMIQKKIKANVDFYLAEYRTDQQVRDERVQKQKSKRAGVENIHR